MSIDVKYNVKISRSVEEAFAVVTDLPRMKDYAAKDILNISPGPVGVGTTFQLVTDFMGEHTVDYKIVGFEPSKKFAYSSSGMNANEITMTFTPIDEGTQLTFELSVKAPGLLAPMLKGSLKEYVTGILTRLVTLIESS
jgi:carbon monoxide dehydrogenase subunit G